MAVPVRLRTSIGKVSLLDSVSLPSVLLDVEDLGTRECMVSPQESRNRWCEGPLLVGLKFQDQSPVVVRSESFHRPSL